MGATVITERKVAGFVRDDGTVIYVLFEKAYEGNCHPHRDYWGCIEIGSYEEVLRRLFARAASCEDGGIESESGRMKPEDYLQWWFQAFAATVEFPSLPITLRMNNSLGSTVPEINIDKVRRTLAYLGRPELFCQLENGEGVCVSLQDDIDIILAIYRSGCIPPWRILDQRHAGSVQREWLAPQPTPIPASKIGITIYRLSQDELLIRIGSSPWYINWCSLIIGTCIEQIAYNAELARPGYYREMIVQIRDWCRTAPPIPDAARLLITRAPKGCGEWNVQQADELARKLGIVSMGEAVPEKYECDFSDVVSVGGTDLLSSLALPQLVWDIPFAPITEVG